MSPRTGTTSKPAKPAAPKAARRAAVAKPVAKPAAKPVAKPAAKPAATRTRTPAIAKPPARPAVAKPAPAKQAAAPAKAMPIRSAPAANRPPVELPVNKVTKRDHKHFEERLLEVRGRLLKELGYLEANVLKQNQRDSSGDLSGYSFHMADLGTDAMEREKAFLFASAEGRAIYDVDEALRRLYNGNYGTCESCQLPIARERLEVVPHARLCVRCKEREEKAGRR